MPASTPRVRRRAELQFGHHHRFRARITEDVSQLALAVEHVDGHDDDAEARGGEEEVEVFEAVGEVQREPIAARQPARRERRRHPVRALVEVGKRVLLARPLQRDLVSAGRGRWVRTGLGSDTSATVQQALSVLGDWCYVLLSAVLCATCQVRSCVLRAVWVVDAACRQRGASRQRRAATVTSH